MGRLHRRGAFPGTDAKPAHHIAQVSGDFPDRATDPIRGPQTQRDDAQPGAGHQDRAAAAADTRIADVQWRRCSLEFTDRGKQLHATQAFPCVKQRPGRVAHDPHVEARLLYWVTRRNFIMDDVCCKGEKGAGLPARSCRPRGPGRPAAPRATGVAPAPQRPASVARRPSSSQQNFSLAR